MNFVFWLGISNFGWISNFDLKLWILILNFEFSIKLNSIWMKFCTRGLLRSLITNPNSKFRNSIWRIQMADQNAKSYLTWKKFCTPRFLRFTRAVSPPPPPPPVYPRHFTPHMGSTFSFSIFSIVFWGEIYRELPCFRNY